MELGEKNLPISFFLSKIVRYYFRMKHFVFLKLLKIKPSNFFAMAWILEEIQLCVCWLCLLASVAVPIFRSCIV